MKPLHQFINEAMIDCPVFESFGSPMIEEILSKLKKSYYANKTLLSSFKWDEITDNDIEKVTPEEARKLAYKKDSGAIVLWISKDNELIADTIGHYLITFHEGGQKIGLDYYNCKVVKNLVPYSDYAIVIKDPDKFSTKELRRLRVELKKDALALKSEEQVREENMKKFEKMKQQILIDKDANSVTLEAKFEKAKSLYNECSEAISNLEILKDKVKYMRELNEKFDRILKGFDEAIDKVEDMETFETTWSKERAAQILNILNSILSGFDAYCKKLLVKVSD